jgi:tRNA/tmRNA/rRNA uracil-C5-methylase (TrmA/RlmC/RlmD family)
LRTLGPAPPIPCVVLDPFAGSGTVGVVCRKSGRNFIGIELNPQYAEMARQRIANPEPEPEVPDVDGQETLWASDNATDAE